MFKIMPRWQENNGGCRTPATRFALGPCELRAGCRSVCKLGEFVEGQVFLLVSTEQLDHTRRKISLIQ